MRSPAACNTNANLMLQTISLLSFYSCSFYCFRNSINLKFLDFNGLNMQSSIPLFPYLQTHSSSLYHLTAVQSHRSGSNRDTNLYVSIQQVKSTGNLFKVCSLRSCSPDNIRKHIVWLPTWAVLLQQGMQYAMHLVTTTTFVQCSLRCTIALHWEKNWAVWIQLTNK